MQMLKLPHQGFIQIHYSVVKMAIAISIALSKPGPWLLFASRPVGWNHTGATDPLITGCSCLITVRWTTSKRLGTSSWTRPGERPKGCKREVVFLESNGADSWFVPQIFTKNMWTRCWVLHPGGAWGTRRYSRGTVEWQPGADLRNLRSSVAAQICFAVCWPQPTAVPRMWWDLWWTVTTAPSWHMARQGLVRHTPCAPQLSGRSMEKLLQTR